MNTDKLAELGQHLHAKYIAPGKVAGTSVLVARHGEICYVDQQGLADRERGTPMKADTIFRIYSMTKPITSVAIMMLVEEGLCAIEEPVHKYIPEFAQLRIYQSGEYPDFKTTASKRAMSIRDLLMHTAGFAYGLDTETSLDRAYQRMRMLSSGPGEAMQPMIDKLASVPLNYSPGDSWQYSIATDVLGHLVEILSAQTLSEFFQQRIFNPLAMVDTSFTISTAKEQRFAACYEKQPSGVVALQDDPNSSSYTVSRRASGGGGLLSTVKDYNRFCQMLLNGGALAGERLLKTSTVEQMTRNHLPGQVDLASVASGTFTETGFDGIGFGLGFAISQSPEQNGSPATHGTYYWGGMASTIFWIDPAKELVVIFMTQLIPSSSYNFRGELEQIIYNAIDN
ncbi:MAG: serine hydrolase domain-containing protein [Pseudomonadota bacterium]